jgi:predicted CopG family antitoxin
MQTTTVRVRKPTQEKLKKLSADMGTSISDLIDKLLEEHRKSFWKGFNEEAKEFLDREEKKARKTFEKSLGDGLEGR